MLQFLAGRAIRAFERRWGYDGSYMREILNEAGIGAILPLDALSKVSRYRRGVPAGVYYAAKLTAARAADCGPCLALTVSMAEAAGVPPPTLRALVMGERDALGPDERLGADLALAALARASTAQIADVVLRRWGRRGLVSLAYGIVAAQAFPTLKYVLGHGHACTRVTIGGTDVAPEKLSV